ncbi:unnamed protein product [Rotaria sp. Silwood1]|nr:unnamed protein product [Rotaria sp. Silwood1]
MINTNNVLNLFSELVRRKYPESARNEPSSNDHELADQLFLLFDQLLNSTELLVDNIVTLDFDIYNDDNEDYEEESTETNPIIIDGIKYSYATMIAVVEYSKTHTFLSLRNRYRSIKYKQQLRRIKQYVNAQGTRKQKLQRIDEYVFSEFVRARESYLPIHDFDLRGLAIKKARSLNLNGFTASHRWMLDFKRRHNISSRKITKLITKNHLDDREKILKSAENFVKIVNNVIPNYPVDYVLNTDQSSFK